MWPSQKIEKGRGGEDAQFHLRHGRNVCQIYVGQLGKSKHQDMTKLLTRSLNNENKRCAAVIILNATAENHAQVQTASQTRVPDIDSKFSLKTEPISGITSQTD